MRSIAKAQRGMNRSLSRKYLSTTRCINPGDPGCGRMRAERWTKRDQRKLDKETEEWDKARFRKKIGELPPIAKRRVIGSDEEPSGASPKKGGPTYQSPASFELEKRTENQAKRGAKLKTKTAIKKKAVAVKAKYGIAKKASKKGGKK